MKKAGFLLIGIILILSVVVGCSAEEAVYTTLSDATDDAQVIIRGQADDDVYRVPAIDSLTNTIVTLGLAHYEVHEGSAFISDYVDEALVDDATIVLAFKTMSGTNRVHLFVQFVTLVGGDVIVWEGASWNNQSGSLSSIRNRKREVTMASSGLLEDSGQAAFTATDNVILNPVGLDTSGAILVHHIFSWGQKNQILAGTARDTQEIILQPGTQYAVVFTADGNNNKAQLILNWYEHTDKTE